MKKSILSLALLFSIYTVSTAASVGQSSFPQPWVDTRGYSSFASATATAARLGRGVVVSTAMTISTATTVTVPVQVVKGGKYVRSGSGTLTIDGPFDAVKDKVFYGFSSYNLTVTKNANVDQFYAQWTGAVGDGTTDSTSAIQTAIDSLSDGGVVFFTPGKYLITSGLRVRTQGLWLAGGGPTRLYWPVVTNATELFLGAGFSGAMVTFEKDLLSQNTFGCGIRDLTFNGNSRTYGVDAAIHVQYSDVFTLSHVTITKVKGSGLLTGRTVRSYIANLDITDCGDTDKPGVFAGNIDSTGDVTQATTFVGLRIEGNYLSTYLTVSTHSQDNSFVGVNFETNAGVTDTYQTYIVLDGDRNSLSNIHMNKNAGAVPRVIIDTAGKHNVISNVISGGESGGDIFHIYGYLNAISNVNISGAYADLWSFKFFQYAVHNTVHNAVINGFQAAYFASAAINNTLNGIKVYTHRDIIILDESTTHASTHLDDRNYYVNITTDEHYYIDSAATVTLPWGHDYIVVLGTTNIDAIAEISGWPGRVIYLQFNDILTVNDTGSLALAGPFTSSANDILTLIWAGGATWREVSRSVN